VALKPFEVVDSSQETIVHRKMKKWQGPVLNALPVSFGLLESTHECGGCALWAARSFSVWGFACLNVVGDVLKRSTSEKWALLHVATV
jgi:hypothetical protein